MGLYIIIMLPVFIFSLWAQFKVKSSFTKYSKKFVNSGYTGAQAAELILSHNGLSDVRVERTTGWLSDHYSPNEKVLRLSNDVYNSNSISAVGVAAHEAGHAVQHSKEYSVMKLWLAFAKPAALSSNAAIWLIVIGFLLNLYNLAMIGFWFFVFVVVFQIITLPVEFNASTRAKEFLYKYGVVSTEQERAGVSAVLDSAALTYVAAAAASLAQLLYFAIRLGLLGGSRD
jgi:uncharacterized protein